jgi:hypothetical protein
MKYILSTVLLLLVTVMAKAQDTLMMKSGEQRTVKITEIGLDEIKYTVWGLESSPVVVVAKKEVDRIVFSNGEQMRIQIDPMSVESMMSRAVEKDRVIKFEFFSPLGNKLTFGFEHVLRPGFNLEYKLGIIGAGFRADRPAAGGAFVKAGAKFWSGKDYYVRGMRMSHPLRGAYIRPEIAFSQFWQEQEYYAGPWMNSQTRRINYTNIGVQICFGKQILLGDVMTLDWYFGIGYGYQGSDAPDSVNGIEDISWEWEPNAYSHIYAGSSFPLIFSSGMTLGVLF